jgi:hypothetical protein
MIHGKSRDTLIKRDIVVTMYAALVVKTIDSGRHRGTRGT